MRDSIWNLGNGLPMIDAFICDAIRTPIGRYGGALSSVRTDDLAALPLKELMARSPAADWDALDDVIYGCANQAGEDNRNVARMAALLSGLPVTVPGATINRLCGSGLDAIAVAARAIRSGEAEFLLAGGVESMSRAPYVVSKPDAAFARDLQLADTTLGWRFVNPLIRQQYGVDSMPETGENVAERFGIARADQDAFALRSQQRALTAQASGRLALEIVPVTVPARRGAPVIVDRDEHPRETTLAALSRLATPFRAWWNRHGGKRVGRERRRLRARGRVRGSRDPPRSDAARENLRHGRGRGRAEPSWVSARRRRHRSCSSGSGCDSRRSTSSS